LPHLKFLFVCLFMFSLGFGLNLSPYIMCQDKVLRI